MITPSPRVTVSLPYVMPSSPRVAMSCHPAVVPCCRFAHRCRSVTVSPCRRPAIVPCRRVAHRRRSVTVSPSRCHAVVPCRHVAHSRRSVTVSPCRCPAIVRCRRVAHRRRSVTVSPCRRPAIVRCRRVTWPSPRPCCRVTLPSPRRRRLVADNVDGACQLPRGPSAPGRGDRRFLPPPQPHRRADVRHLHPHGCRLLHLLRTARRAQGEWRPLVAASCRPRAAVRMASSVPSDDSLKLGRARRDVDKFRNSRWKAQECDFVDRMIYSIRTKLIYWIC